MSKFTNSQDIALPVAVWLASDDYDGINEDNAISVTSLMKPVREIVLAGRATGEPMAQDIQQLIASSYGTAIHDAIEKAWLSNPEQTLRDLGYPKKVAEKLRINPDEPDEDNINVFMENRESRVIAGITVNGKYDFVIEEEVHDFKTTGTYSWINDSKADDYILQGSMYRWLNPTKITSDYITIHFIFTDWSALQAKTSKGYPPLRIMSRKYELMPLGKTEEWIRSKLSEIRRFAAAPDNEIPLCTPKELWQSDPVYKYYRDPNKTTRSTKNYKTQAEALARLAQDGNKGLVLTTFGAPKKCAFCAALNNCAQADQYIAEGKLKL
jgi:hypothetical protein